MEVDRALDAGNRDRPAAGARSSGRSGAGHWRSGEEKVGIEDSAAYMKRVMARE